MPETAYLVDSPEPVAGLRHSWRGELADAREITERYLALAAERGEGVSYAWLRLNLTELELRAGNWDAAARLLDEWADTDDGMFLITPTYQRCRALLALGRGDPAEARRWAEPALEEAAARGYAWPTLEATRALGQAALLAHEPERAAAYLRAVWEHTEREGVDEPGAFPVAGELVEALSELGALDEAHAVTERLRTLGRRRPSVGARHARPLRGPSTRGGGRLRGARPALRRRPRAARARPRPAPRTPVARRPRGARGRRGRLRRARLARAGRGRPRPSSRASAGASRARPRRADRDRAAGRRPRRRRAARNKEIAQALFVTVHTVEAHLSSTYAKLGIRTRTQLAAHL